MISRVHMKTVIVAGGLGFIGSHLTNALLRRNDVEKVVVVDNLWTGTRATKPILPILALPSSTAILSPFTPT